MRLTLLRLATVRLTHQWPLALAQLVGLAASVGLAVMVPLVQSTASEAGLRSVVNGLGSKRFVTIEQLQVADTPAYAAFESDAERRTRAAAGTMLVPEARFAQGPKVRPNLLNGKQFSVDTGDPIPDIASWEHVQDHVRVTAGSWPGDGSAQGTTYAVALSTEGAHDFGYALNDTVCYPVFTGISFCARIAALYQPLDANDSYWGGSLPEHSLLFGPGDYWALVKQVNSVVIRPGPGLPPPPRTALLPTAAAQVWAPDFSNLHARDISLLAERLNGLRGYFAVQREGLFLTGLDAGVKGFGARYDVAAFTIQMVAAALLVIALYSLSFVGTHFFDSQAPLMAVLQARGWSRLRVWLLLMAEVGMLAAVALPLGLATAYLVALAIGQSVFGGTVPRLGGQDLLALLPFTAAAVLAALAVLGGLAAATSRRGVLEVRRAVSRASAQPWWQWRNLDLGLAVLAVPLLFEVQLRGSGRVREASTAAQGDVLGLLLPALALLLLAVASLRLLPVAARVIGLAGRGLPADLAAWQLTRQPGQSARLAILLALTVAVGMFSSIYAATDHRNTIDRAAYASGADVRAVFTGENTDPPNVDQYLGGVPDVAAASTTYRGAVTPGKSNLDATVLAIDAGTFRQVAWSRGDLAAEPIDLLTQKLVDADPDGTVLPGRPDRLSLWTYSSGFLATLTADVTDATGAHCTCSLGDLGTAGARTLTATLAFPASPRYPLRLRALQVHTSGVALVNGELALGPLQVTEAGGPPALVEAFAAHDGWWQETLGKASSDDDLQASLRHPRDGQPTTTVDVHLTPGTPLVIRPAPTAQPLPALVAARTLDELGVGLHQAFPMHVDEVVVNVTAVGVVDYFPTFYPGRDQFLIVPRDTLLARLGHEHNALAWPNEAWLKVDGSPASTEAALRKAPGLLDVSDRRSMTAAGLGDPLRLALQSTLAVGFAAALAMAVVGFALHFLVAARSRLSQYAVLQANGLPRGLVARSLLAEQAVMLLHGIVVGAALALLMAWAILPSLQVSGELTDVVPPTLLAIDPLTVAAVLAVVALAALLAGQLASRAGGRLRLLDELRLLG